MNSSALYDLLLLYARYGHTHAHTHTYTHTHTHTHTDTHTHTHTHTHAHRLASSAFPVSVVLPNLGVSFKQKGRQHRRDKREGETRGGGGTDGAPGEQKF